MEKGARPLCVVLDTSVLCSKKFLLLKTSVSEALLYALQRRHGKIGLPEVVEIELERHLIQVGGEASEKLFEAYEIVREFAGYGVLDYFPRDIDFAAAIRKRLDELEEFFVRVPFTLAHAKRALHRVNDRLPPNSLNNQQYKDSAIWEALLELAAQYDVIFVTADKGFFHERDPRRGLARVLVEEIEQLKAPLRVVHSNDSDVLLAELQEGIPSLETDLIVRLVEPRIRGLVEEHVREESIELGELREAKLGVFRTRSTSQVAVGFTLVYSTLPPDGSAQPPAALPTITAHGICRYEFESDSVTDVQLTSQNLEWPTGSISTYYGMSADGIWNNVSRALSP